MALIAGKTSIKDVDFTGTVWDNVTSAPRFFANAQNDKSNIVLNPNVILSEAKDLKAENLRAFVITEKLPIELRDQQGLTIHIKNQNRGKSTTASTQHATNSFHIVLVDQDRALW